MAVESESVILAPWEEAIAKEIRRRGRSASRVGPWIYGHLRETREDYPAEMHRQYADFLRRVGSDVQAGPYSSFAQSIWWLHRAGLLERSRSGRGPKGFAITFYKLAEGKADASLWRNPLRAYPSYKRNN